MLRKSKRLLDRSASANSDSVENEDPGSGVMENTPFVNAGSAAPIVGESSAAVIPVENGLEDSIVTIANSCNSGEGDVVVADVDVVEEEGGGC